MAGGSALGDLLEMQPGHGEDDLEEDSGRSPAWVPGLPTLQAQQRELVSRLRSGFESRREVLLWTHAVAALSFGHIPDDWPRKVVGTRFVVGALLADPEDRASLCTHPPSEGEAEYIRDSLQQAALSEAWRAARSDIRASAADHTDGDGGVGDPGRQRFLGMRPRLHQVAIEQHQALQAAFSGFESRRAVLDWVDQMDYATLGYLPKGFPSRVARPTSDWWSALTADDPGAWLEVRLAGVVLPACKEALRDAMEAGTEEPDTISEMEVPSG